MKKLAVCFTDNGERIIEKINSESRKRGITPLETEGKFTGDIAVWAHSVFLPGNALIFVGAVGIAVRAISDLPKDKLSDCPVIVIDDAGCFVIPILSGHAGGANKLAFTLAELLGAIPVITTSTDVNSAFSVDMFAIENGLAITDREGIKKVSVKAIRDKKVTLSIKDYPPKESVDVIVADETDRECSLLLAPKRYTVGLGMKKGKEAKAVEDFFIRTLDDNGIDIGLVYSLCTIDLKEDEEAMIHLRDKYRIPVMSFDVPLLNKAEGKFTASAFVEDTVGVDNVCERAAILGAGSGSHLVVTKTCEDGMTIAVAERANVWGRFM